MLRGTNGGRSQWSVAVCFLADVEDITPLEVTVVVGLDLLGDPLAERFLQGVFAGRVQHLLLDWCRIRTPINTIIIILQLLRVPSLQTLAVTWSNLNQFYKFFHWQTQQEIWYTIQRYVDIPPYLMHVATLPCETWMSEKPTKFTAFQKNQANAFCHSMAKWRLKEQSQVKQNLKQVLQDLHNCCSPH